MNIQGRGRIIKGKYGYSISESIKDRNGNYIPNFIKVRFPKAMSILPENKEVIKIVRGFSTPYLDQNNKTMISYMVMEWKSIGTSRIEETKQEEVEENPYKQFGEENEELYTDLPF